MPKIWIILDHPHQLIYAIRMCKIISDEKINVLISCHEYWTEEYFVLCHKNFQEVHRFRRVTYNINILEQMWSIFILIKKIKNMGVGRQDLIVGFSCCQFLENIVISTHRNNFTSLIIAESTYKEEKKQFIGYKWILSGFISNFFIEPLFHLNRTYYMQKDGTLEDGKFLLRYKKPIEQIYDNIIVMKNITNSLDVVKTDVSKIIECNYPFNEFSSNKNFDILKNPSNMSEKNKIIFFGTPFIKFKNIDETKYILILNDCLNYLRHNYQENFVLVYKPHPHEHKEIDLLNLQNFEIETDVNMAELYLEKNIDCISKIFSVTSTVLRVGLNLGISSYSFMELFPFETVSKEYFYNLFGSVPPEFFIIDLKLKPLEYHLVNPNGISSFDTAIKQMIDNYYAKK